MMAVAFAGLLAGAALMVLGAWMYSPPVAIVLFGFLVFSASVVLAK